MEQATIQVKSIFTEDELLEKGKLLSTNLQDKEDIQLEAKEIAKEYKGKIERKDVVINQLRDDIHNEFEFIDTLCNIELDFTRKIRKYVNVHTAVVEEERPLTKDDYQLQILPEVKPITSSKVEDID